MSKTSKSLVPYSKSKAFMNKAKSLVKKGIKFGGLAAIGVGGLYLAGSKKRRYAKAPKFGEGRDLRDKFTLAKPDKRTFL